MEIAIAALVILALVVANAMATRTVLRDEFGERSQKAAQLIAIWLVPVVGALFVFALHRRPEEPSRKYKEIPDPGDDFGASGRGVRSTHSNLDD